MPSLEISFSPLFSLTLNPGVDEDMIMCHIYDIRFITIVLTILVLNRITTHSMII